MNTATWSGDASANLHPITHGIKAVCLVCGTARRRTYVSWLLIGHEGRGYFVKVSDIDWIEAARNCVRLHAGEDVHILRSTMSQIEARLDPTAFLRIHRSTIVNFERIKEIFNGGCGHHSLTLTGDTRLRVSTTYWHRLKEIAR